MPDKLVVEEVLGAVTGVGRIVVTRLRAPLVVEVAVRVVDEERPRTLIGG